MNTLIEVIETTKVENKMSKKLVDHLLSVNYRGITNRIKQIQKPITRPKSKT